MKMRFTPTLLFCLVAVGCTSQPTQVQTRNPPPQGAKAATTTQLELPYFNWTFHISDQWVIQQRSTLFNLPKTTEEDQFRQRLKKNRTPLFTLIPKAQQDKAPNTLTLVASLPPLRGEPKSAIDWLTQQIHYLSLAYPAFEWEETPAWTSDDKHWAKARFSFADPGTSPSVTSPPVRVHSTFLAMVENGVGLIVAVANPTGDRSLEDGLMDRIKQMVQIPSRALE